MLDAEGIDAVVLYTTVGLLWEAELDDAELSQAYTRAYNRWICEFCAGSDRLVPTAHLSLSDPGRGRARAGARGRRRRARRVRRAVHPRRPPARSSRATIRSSRPRRISTSRSRSTRRSSRSGPRARAWARGSTSSSCGCSPSVQASDGVRHQFTTLFDYGVFDKFPRLKVLVLESGGGWIGYWLDRIDAVYGHTVLGTRVPLEHKPSDYFRDRCWISCDPDERTIPALGGALRRPVHVGLRLPPRRPHARVRHGPRGARGVAARRPPPHLPGRQRRARCSASTPDPPRTLLRQPPRLSPGLELRGGWFRRRNGRGSGP